MTTVLPSIFSLWNDAFRGFRSRSEVFKTRPKRNLYDVREISDNNPPNKIALLSEKRDMFTSRLKDMDSTLFCCILKTTYNFFFLSSSICYLYLLTPLSHMYYSLNLSYFFLINVIPFVLVFFLFTIIQILIDFFRGIFFLLFLKASKESVPKSGLHFFS